MLILNVLLFLLITNLIWKIFDLNVSIKLKSWNQIISKYHYFFSFNLKISVLTKKISIENEHSLSLLRSVEILGSKTNLGSYNVFCVHFYRKSHRNKRKNASFFIKNGKRFPLLFLKTPKSEKKFDIFPFLSSKTENLSFSVKKGDL